MGLEASATYIDSLVVTNPDGAVDPGSELDSHIHLIKGALKRTFPNVTGAVTASHAELNLLDGVTGALFDEQVAYKSSDEARTSDISMSADDALTLTLSQTGNYLVEFALRYSSLVADIIYGVFAGGVNLNYSVVFQYNYGDEGDDITGSATISLAADGNTRWMMGKGRASFSSGAPKTLSINWAQGTSSGTSSSIRAGSWLRVTKV